MKFLIFFMIMSGVYINLNKKIQGSGKAAFNAVLAIIAVFVVLGQII